jgi:hypothetical protein
MTSLLLVPGAHPGPSQWLAGNSPTKEIFAGKRENFEDILKQCDKAAASNPSAVYGSNLDLLSDAFSKDPDLETLTNLMARYFLADSRPTAPAPTRTYMDLLTRTNFQNEASLGALGKV